MKEPWVRVRSGFSSTVFLVLFLIATAYGAVLMDIFRKNMETLVNLKEVQNRVEVEAIVLNDVKCYLINESFEDETIDSQGTQYTLTWGLEEVAIQILSPIEETLILNFDGEGSILDVHLSGE